MKIGDQLEGLDKKTVKAHDPENPWISKMEGYVGRIGGIVCLCHEIVIIQFSDGEYFLYPRSAYETTC